MPSPVNIADVAAKVGCSKMSVSRALRGKTGVSQPLVDRILQAAQELGYRPDPMVSALMQRNRLKNPEYHNSNIALLHYYKTKSRWTENKHLRIMTEGAIERAKALGYYPDTIWALEQNMSPQRLSDMLRARGIRGIVFHGVPEGRENLILDWPKFAVAAMGTSINSPQMHRAAGYHYHSIPFVVSELTKRGYTRIGISISRFIDSRFEYAWEASVTSLMVNPNRIAEIFLFREENGMAHLPEWIAKNHVDAFIDAGLNINKSFWLEHNIHIPNELGYVSVLESLPQDWKMIGSAAVDLVDAQLMRNERGIPTKRKTLLIESNWMPPNTIRSLADSGAAK